MTKTVTFPHPTLTCIHGTPTNTSLKQLTKEVYANAHAVLSARGGNSHGHLSLVISLAKYPVLTGIAFQLLAHPGPAPIHATGATQFHIAKTSCLYEAKLVK